MCNKTIIKSQVEKIMIGVDGGGTKTEFVMFTQSGAIISRIVLGACNPNAVGGRRMSETSVYRYR